MKLIKKKPELLSNYPSEAILQALEDLETCEAHPNYKIDMGIWHRMDNNICTVCQAGAILACRPSSLEGGRMSPIQLEDDGPYDTIVENRLYARQVSSFDDLRWNKIYSFMREWVSEVDAIALHDRYHKTTISNKYAYYADNPELYKTWLKGVSKFLKNEGY